MRQNGIRDLLNAGKPTFGTRVHSSWPTVVEIIGHTGMFDYVEFSAEYAPFDLYALDDFCRAAELHDLSTMIKIDQDPRAFLAQRAIGSGFQAVLFADCRSADDARACVRAVRPDTPEDGGIHGVGLRRASYMTHTGLPEHVQALRDIVILLMIEKKSFVDNLEEALSVGSIDMVQWGPADYSMSIGDPGAWLTDPAIRATEKQVIEKCLEMGVQPRAEIDSPDAARYYLDLGVRHFCIGMDIMILYHWLRRNGEELRKVVDGA